MQVPGPDTRVVELRVHGILGTTGDTLTDSVASVDVAGDGIGRIVRPADRLLRPVAGPALSVGERSVPRVVEGYVWGGMTSGGWAKATWALLFPFSLANVAHWMLPPVRDNAASRGLLWALRALLRLAALLLTMLFVGQLTVVTLDLFAAQCLASGSGCLPFLPDVLRGSTLLRKCLGLLPSGLVVLLMHRLSAVSWRVSTGRSEGSEHSARAPVLPGTNVVSDPDTPALRALHITAALSTVVVLALGGPFALSADPRWLLGMVGLLGSLVGAVLVDDPTGSQSSRTGKWMRTAMGRIVRRSLIGVSALVFAAVILLPGGLAPGSGTSIDALNLALVAVCGATAVLLVPACLLARSAWSGTARGLRPWAGGWVAAPMLLMACMLGDGFGAGLGLSVRQILGGVSRLPAAYYDVAVFWGATAVLMAVAAAVLIPTALVLRWRNAGEAVPEEVALLHAGRPEDQRSAARAWRWANLQRRYSHHVLLIIAAVLTASTVLSIAFRTAGLPPDAWAGWLVGVGVAALAGLAGTLLRMVYLAGKSRSAGRYLGVLFDLTLFWPREAHPVVPPCYALKVIPELASRAAEHLADPDTRVVLVGHSQGSLLAAVATARLLDSLPEADRERVGLVTAGSQLQWAYPRAFPSVVPHDSLRDLAGRMDGRWRALCRGTDPLGGAIGTWNRQVYDGMLIGVGFRPDGTTGPLPAASRGPTGALVLGGDHWLPDPQRGPFSHRRWTAGVLAHTEYSGDPEWDRSVSMAAGLESPTRGAALSLSTPAGAPVSHRATTDPVPAPCGPEDQQPTTPAEQEAGELDEAAPAQASVPAEQRPEPAELPELVDPPGRTAPWERGSALRTQEK